MRSVAGVVTLNLRVNVNYVNFYRSKSNIPIITHLELTWSQPFLESTEANEPVPLSQLIR